MNYEKSEADGDVKPQCAVTKTVTPPACINTNTDSSIEFVFPSEPFAPENKHNNHPSDDDTRPNEVGDDGNSTNSLIKEEDKGEDLFST